MTNKKSKLKQFGFFVGGLSLLFVVIQTLNLSLAMGNPDLLLLNEARSNNPVWLVSLRVRTASIFGGRADSVAIGYGSKTPLQVASERGNTGFLAAAMEFASQENLGELFDTACRDDNEAVIEIIRRQFPMLVCPHDAQAE